MPRQGHRRQDNTNSEREEASPPVRRGLPGPQYLLQASPLQAALALQASEPQMDPQSLHLQGWPVTQPSLSITLSDAASTGVRAKTRRARVVLNAFMSVNLGHRGQGVKSHLD